MPNEPRMLYELDGMMNVHGWKTMILMRLWCDDEISMDFLDNCLIAKIC